MAEKILARAIIEILGKPKEHVEKTLKDYVAKLKADKLKIKKEEFAPVKENNDMFTSFAELEIEFADLHDLMDFCLESMPASVEIISPESLTTTAADVTSALTDLTGHIHQMDMLIKESRARTDLIDRNAVALFRNFVLHLLSQKTHTLAELSKILGIRETDLKPFLDRMIEVNLIIPEDNAYKIVK